MILELVSLLIRALKLSLMLNVLTSLRSVGRRVTAFFHAPPNHDVQPGSERCARGGKQETSLVRHALRANGRFVYQPGLLLRGAVLRIFLLLAFYLSLGSLLLVQPERFEDGCFG